MRILVAIARRERQELIELDLPEGSTVADALRAAAVEAQSFGVWSRPCPPETRLREGDRVEVYRPLAADPKQARRNRARLKPSTRSRSGP